MTICGQNYLHLGERKLFYLHPPESFDVKTEDCGKSSDTELLGAGLFRLATLAIESLTVCQLLSLNKFLQAIVNIADW